MARQRSKSPVRASTTGTGSRTPRAAAVDSTSDATASPYRTPGWTVAKLKEELRQRQLSTAGSKQELVERLEESSGVDEEVAVETAG